MLVAGARLQGCEAIYLAKEAGYYVIAVDIDPDAPGGYLADEFYEADINDREKMSGILSRADMVLPAVEDIRALEALVSYGREFKIPVLFDMDAYRISSSKERSNRLFEEIGLPVPGKYPDCGFPVIIKPDNKSGSENVYKAYSEEEVQDHILDHPGDDLILQEFLEGPSYSLEVIGNGSDFYFPQITQVIADDDYDCCCIAAPAEVSEDIRKQMYSIAAKLAAKLKIRGIFDIEVIDHNGTLKVLEIDARLPSQTPISVYRSKKINMVKLMAELFCGKKPEIPKTERSLCCLYQQICVEDGCISVMGEHIMAGAGHLKIIKDFYGADEVITDYEEGAASFRAIVIISRNTFAQAQSAFEQFEEDLRNRICRPALTAANCRNSA